MAVVGRASVYVAPSFTGFQTRVGRAAKGAGQTMSGEMTKSTRGLGSRMAGAIGRGLMLAGKATAAGAGIAMGAAVVGGFKSAIAQENAQATLSGLYGSAKQATSQMGALRKVASQSPLSLKAYTDMAQSLAYMGIKGPKAAAAAKNIGAAIIGAGGGAEQMGRASDALLGMVNAGKVQLDTLNQLSDAQVPIFSGLAAHFGTSIAQVREMVTNGKVGIDDVLSVVQNATGKTFQMQIASGHQAARTLGNTFKRAATNVQDSIGRIMLPALRAITPIVAKMGARAVKIINRIPDAFKGLRDLIVRGDFTGALKRAFGWSEDSPIVDAILRIRNAFKGIASSGALAAFTPLLTVLKGAGPALAQVGRSFLQIGAALGGALAAVLPTLARAFVTLATAIASTLVHVLPTVAAAFATLARLVPLLVPVFNAVVPVAAAVASVLIRMLQPILSSKTAVLGLIGAFVLFKTVRMVQGVITGVTTAMRLQALATNASASATRSYAIVTKAQVIWFRAFALAQRIATAATWLYNTAIKSTGIQAIAVAAAQRVAATASRVFAIAQRAVGIAMRFALGPVGLIITAVGLLVAGFIYAYKHSATFRKIVQGALHGVAAAGRFMWNRVLKPAFNGMVIAFKAVGRFFTAIGHGIVAIFRRIGAIARWLWVKLLRPYFAAWMKVFRTVGRVFRAVWRGFLQPVFQLFGAIVKWFAVKIFRVYMGIIRIAFRTMANLLRKVYNAIIKPVINLFAKIGRWLQKTLLGVFAQIRLKWLLLATKVRIFYNRHIKPIFDAFGKLGNWLRKTLARIFATIRLKWIELTTKVRIFYNRHIKPIFDAFGRAAGKLRDLASRAFKGVRGAWSTTSSHLGRVFRGAMTGTFNAFKKAGSGMRSAFGTAVGGIGKAWKKLANLAKKPIHFVVATVINKALIGGFNKLADFFEGKDARHIKPLPVPFAKGGIFPGYTPGRDVGLAAVSGGEPIMRPEFGRAVGEPWVNAANAAARRGGISGAKQFMAQQTYGAYASGGIVKPTRSGRQNPSYAGHSGIDFFGRVGDPILAATAGRITYTGSGRGYGNAIFEQSAKGLQMVYGHTSRILARVGQMVQAGQKIGEVGYSGNVRPPGPGGAHLHFEIAPGGGFAQASNRAATQKWLGGGGLVGKIIGAIKGVASKLNPVNLISGAVNKALGAARWLSQTPFGQMAAAAPKKLASMALDYVKDKFAGFFAGDAVSASWSGQGVGSLGRDQLNNAATIMKTAKAAGVGRRGALIGLMTAMQESTLRNLAGGDRDSVGLFQQRAPWGPYSARHNPAAAAAMFFNGGRGGQPGLKSKNWQSMGLAQAAQAVQVSAFPSAYAKWEGLARQLVGKGYAGGTDSATAGLHRIAENGPELVTRPQTRLFTGRERVDNAADTAALFGAQKIRLESGALVLRNGQAFIEEGVGKIVKDAQVST